MPVSAFFLMLLIVLGPAIGCGVDGSCDEGQVSAHGVCLAAPDAGGDAPDEDAGDEVDAADVCTGLTYSGFGDVCTDPEHSDCPMEADICAIQPGDTEGFCTRLECLDHPCICPPDWTCFDLSSIMPEVGSVCISPGLGP